MSKDIFGDILDKFARKLSGWKVNFSSFTGRITLTRSALSSIPVYSMSTLALPSSVCNGIDKICRGFLWGSSNLHKRIHKVAWKEVIKPKKLGGLGVKSMKDLNSALIAKLCWRFMRKDGDIWVSVLTNKYMNSALGASNGASVIWKGIKRSFDEIIIKGARWIVKDGRSINFWCDPWVGDVPLLNWSHGVIDATDLNRNVCDF